MKSSLSVLGKPGLRGAKLSQHVHHYWAAVLWRLNNVHLVSNAAGSCLSLADLEQHAESDHRVHGCGVFAKWLRPNYLQPCAHLRDVVGQHQHEWSPDHPEQSEARFCVAPLAQQYRRLLTGLHQRCAHVTVIPIAQQYRR